MTLSNARAGTTEWRWISARIERTILIVKAEVERIARVFAAVAHKYYVSRCCGATLTRPSFSRAQSYIALMFSRVASGHLTISG